MGRYWSVIYRKDAPVPPPTQELVNVDDGARENKTTGLMDRFVLGITYSSSSTMALRVLEGAGYIMTLDHFVIVASATRASRYPDLALLGRFFREGEMTWPPDECVKIARDMRLLFNDTLNREAAARAEGRVPWVPDEYEVDEDVDTHTDSAILEHHFPWGETVLLVFEEAVTRQGSVETN